MTTEQHKSSTYRLACVVNDTEIGFDREPNGKTTLIMADGNFIAIVDGLTLEALESLAAAALAVGGSFSAAIAIRFWLRELRRKRLERDINNWRPAPPWRQQ